MRKRIECKVINSTPLSESGSSTRNAAPGHTSSTINDHAAFTYTARLIATRTSVDDDLTSQALDLYV
ncbi:MAG: hypothetical protein P8Z79_06815 [Sedimentisphaerales bacterium]|jgi:hypothetical protein